MTTKSTQKGQNIIEDKSYNVLTNIYAFARNNPTNSVNNNTANSQQNAAANPQSPTHNSTPPLPKNPHN